MAKRKGKGKQQRSVKEIAEEALQYAETACCEVAYDATHGFNVGEFDIPDCDDPTGALADNLYNEADVLHDFLGDRVYELCNGDRDLMNEVYDELSAGAHDALKRAVEMLRR